MTYELSVDQTYDAPPQKVFDAYLAMHGEDRPDWMVESDLDLRVGGVWTVVFHPPGVAEFRELRTFSEVDPPNRLAYAMRLVAEGRPGFETAVELTFRAEGTGTRLTLAQRGFPTEAERDDFAGAWPDVLRQLWDYVR